jgi:hypothetical protein
MNSMAHSPSMSSVLAAAELRKAAIKLQITQLEERARSIQELVLSAEGADDAEEVRRLNVELIKLGYEIQSRKQRIDAPAPLAGGPRR